MRVLAVNKFFFVKGGCERYFFDLEKLLISRGHEVRHLSMRHPSNRTSPDERFFVSKVDFSTTGSIASRLRRGLRVIYSHEGREAMRRAVKELRPDIVHLHNVAHQLSPSILRALRDGAPPAVQTLHDYKLICPVYVLMSGGRVCERCRGGRYYNAVLHNCHPGGLGASLVSAVEMYLHRSVLRSYDAIRIFMCPSKFLMSKIRSFGVDDSRLVHLPYFLPLDEYVPGTGAGDYYVYAGRLSREKGLHTLLEAASRVEGARLLVLGEGPLEGELRERYRKVPWIEFRGYVGGDELKALMSEAAFSVVPSEWYENQPLAVLESFALGVPVVASRIGGLAELVSSGERGLLFEPGDSEGLACAISWLWNCRGEARRMGRAARAYVEREHSPEGHYGLLMDIYARAMQ